MTLPPEARKGVERAFLEVMRRRHPEYTWTVSWAPRREEDVPQSEGGGTTIDEAIVRARRRSAGPEGEGQ